MAEHTKRPWIADGPKALGPLNLDQVGRAATLFAMSLNPYLDEFRRLHGELPLAERRAAGLAPAGDAAFAQRDELRARYSFAVPNSAAIAAIVACGPILEIGAGTGYWAYLLRAAGADVLAYDDAPPGGERPNIWHPADRPFSEVLPGGPTEAARCPERSLLLVWPPYDRAMAAAALRAYRGPTLIYVGEDRGGATATVSFFTSLERDWQRRRRVAIPTWHRIADSLQVFARKEHS